MLKKYQKNITPLAISLIFSVLLGSLYLSNNLLVSGVIQRLDAIPYDLKILLSKTVKSDPIPAIVIIDIDEESITREGRWPWSRHKIAKLVTKLSSAGAAVIATDIVFSEVERNPVDIVEASLQDLNKQLPSWANEIHDKLDADKHFSQAIAGKPIVLGYPFQDKVSSMKGVIKSSSINVSAIDITNFRSIKSLYYTGNLPLLVEQAAATGFFSVFPDSDGIIRSVPLVMRHADELYPSLALEAARLYLFEEKILLSTEKVRGVHTITHIKLGGKEIRTDLFGRILVPYINNEERFPTISASTILHSQEKLDLLEGAIVLIGTSAAGLADLRSTPMHPSYPGVKIQAALIDGLLHPGNLLYTPIWADGAIIVELVFLVLIMIILFPLIRTGAFVFVSPLLLLISGSFHMWLWSVPRINLSMTIPLILIVSISAIYILYRMGYENRRKQEIHNMFGQYVPIEHIDTIMEASDREVFEGDKREMSVLFSDIRDFTALSEHLTTQQLKQFLNRYLTPVTKIIFDSKGTIDKYVGDMVMAFWGAPLNDASHASHAVHTALEMQQLIADMQNEFKDLNISEFAAGIGVNTGEMNVGDMGSDYRRSYTVLSDAVNLGSRLESLTKYYGVKILVSNDTKSQCDDIVFRYVDYVRVKGKNEAVKIYEPICLSGQLDAVKKSLLRNHHQAFECYLDGNWAEAEASFIDLFDATQDSLYSLYLSRIRQGSGKPVDGWEGVFTHKNK